MSTNSHNIKIENTRIHLNERDYTTNETHRNAVNQGNENQASPTSAALPAGQWLRVVLGFEAPFGHDGLPTVWG